MKNITLNTKKFVNLTVNIFLDTYPIDNEKERKKNIQYLFEHTIYSMNECIIIYDRCLFEEKNKHNYKNNNVRQNYENHINALQVAFSLLNE